MKICKDCKYYHSVISRDFWLNVVESEPLCTHPRCTVIDPVHGRKSYRSCERARESFGACGRHGELFESDNGVEV